MSQTQSVFNRIIFSPLLIVNFFFREYVSKFYTYLVFLFLLQFIKAIEISVFKFDSFTCSTLELNIQSLKCTLN